MVSFVVKKGKYKSGTTCSKSAFTNYMFPLSFSFFVLSALNFSLW